MKKLITFALLAGLSLSANAFEFGGSWSGNPGLHSDDSPTGHGTYALQFAIDGELTTTGNLAVYYWDYNDGSPVLTTYISTPFDLAGGQTLTTLRKVAPVAEFVATGEPNPLGQVAAPGEGFSATLTVLEYECLGYVNACPSPLPPAEDVHVTRLAIEWTEDGEQRSLVFSQRF